MELELRNNDDAAVIILGGRIDSTNAPEAEKEIMEAVGKAEGKDVSFELSGLRYISSAGLRVLMKVRKQLGHEITLTEVSPEVYEIFETTGFTELFDVKKRMRRVDVTGLPVIGRGFYGTVYRLDADTIVKVYQSADALKMIENEKKMAKMAFVKGLPTAISFDIVRVGDSYGSVFELLNAKTFNDLIIEQPERADEIIKMHVGVMKQVHAATADPGVLPRSKDVYLGYLDVIREYVPEETLARVRELLDAMPEDDHLIHGDMQMKNVMLSDGEPMLIDMDTLSTGHPFFDIQGLFLTYVAFGEDDPGNSMSFLGISTEMADHIWDGILRTYYDDADEETLGALSDRIRFIAYIRMLYLLAVTDMKEGELGAKRLKHSAEHLAELSERIDRLV